jgi:hypothetical protein
MRSWVAQGRVQSNARKAPLARPPLLLTVLAAYRRCKREPSLASASWEWPEIQQNVLVRCFGLRLGRPLLRRSHSPDAQDMPRVGLKWKWDPVAPLVQGVRCRWGTACERRMADSMQSEE